MLHIIFRTCNRSIKNTEENTTKDVRICGDDRVLLIKKCLYSVIRSANNSGYPYKLTVLDDNSSEDFIDILNNLLKKANGDVKLVRLTEKGFNYSAYMQFLYAKQSDDLFYSVEDDYLHTTNAIKELVDAYQVLYHAVQELTPGKDVIISPWDSHHRYGLGNDGYTSNPLDNISCNLSYINGRYWKNTYASTNTIFSSSSVIRKHFSKFEELAKRYPEVTENQTINTLYYVDSDSLPDMKAPVMLFSPIPSLAYHISYDRIPIINSEGCSWIEMWNNISEEDLV